MKSRTWAILALLLLGGAFMLYQRPETPERILIIHRPADFDAQLAALVAQRDALTKENKPIPAELAKTLKEYAAYHGKLVLVVDETDDEVAGLMEKIDVFFTGTTTEPPAPHPPVRLVAKRGDEVLWIVDVYRNDTLLWNKHDREESGLYKRILDRCGIRE
jgi:hypothetical protein